MNDDALAQATLTRNFSYTVQKAPYLSTIGAFLFLCLAESTLGVFLVLRFVPGVVFQALVLGLPTLCVILMIGRLLAPLFTSHRVSATTLELRYGLDFQASIPRLSLVAARPAQERVGPIPRVMYNAQKDYLALAFSENDQLFLCLDTPRVFRFGLHSVCSTATLLINVDQRAALLALLALPETVQSPQRIVETPQRLPESISTVSAPSPVRVNESQQTTDARPLALRTVDLTRSYSEVVVVDKLNLAVRRGEIYGFLGPNGAGKSTAIKMLVGLLQPTAGQAWLAGYDVCRDPLLAKGALGYAADRALLYDRLSGREFLSFLAQLRELPRELAQQRIDELLNMFELSGEAERLCGSYSFGMKRKLSLAGALLHQPPVLILDEPFNGLDPLSARRLKDLFLHLAAEGAGIFLSTHDLATAESLCHRVGIIQRGRLLIEGSAAELRSLSAAPDLESVFLALTAQSAEVGL